jgi:hypothetical protein
MHYRESGSGRHCAKGVRMAYAGEVPGFSGRLWGIAAPVTQERDPTVCDS